MEIFPDWQVIFDSLTPTALFSFSALVSAAFVLFRRYREWAIKLTAIFLVSTIALIANNTLVYIASLFIIATLFTEGDYLLTLIAIIRGDKGWLDLQKMIKGVSNPPQKDETSRKRSAMEYKILNTLWTKQVNYYADYSKLWGFTINVGAIDYLEFREAADRLLEEGLISRGDQGMYFLTGKGIKFCADNYTTFSNPDDQYWPEEKIKEENLTVAIEGAEKL